MKVALTFYRVVLNEMIPSGWKRVNRLSITVMNNTASSLALGELNKNNNKLSKSLQKILI